MTSPVPPPPIGPEGPGPSPGYPAGYPSHPSHPAYGTGGGPAPYPGGAAPYGYPGGAGVGWGGGVPPARDGLGVASLVLGILSVCVFVLWPLAIVLAVLAVVFGGVARSRASKGLAVNPGQALAGLICGLVGFLLAVLLGVAVIATARSGPVADALPGAPAGPVPSASPVAAFR
ncbi:DUF4190 domain-containing protein [Streptomyces sp. JNUCC 64]